VFQYNISRPLKNTRRVVVSFQIQNICGMKSKPLKYHRIERKLGNKLIPKQMHIGKQFANQCSLDNLMSLQLPQTIHIIIFTNYKTYKLPY
jgi:phenylalanine-4-hydroxylase